MNGSNTNEFRFKGSLWCNLDIALRNLDQNYGQVVELLGLTGIEWYILRAVYEQDGQHASELVRDVGRAATSFTPILDKLQHKDLIERRPDPADRRVGAHSLPPIKPDLHTQLQYENSLDVGLFIIAVFPNSEYLQKALKHAYKPRPTLTARR